MSRLHGLMAVSLAMSIIVAARAQTPPPAPPPSTASPPAGFKVNTRLVQINVLVHDRHGEPVAGLTKEDFEISDNGKAQTIAAFTVDSVNTAPSAAASSTATQRVMPRNIVINRPERQSGVPTSVTVLLLDMYNTKIADQMYARKQILKFLHQIRPQDQVAFYLLKNTGFSVIHDFTNNSESLLAALARLVPGFSGELDASEPQPSNIGDDTMDTLIDTNNTLMANFFIRNRVIDTCLAFKALADHLAALPGRKNVIWVSGGFPIAFGFGDPQDAVDQSQIGKPPQGGPSQDLEMFADYIEGASQAMNTANVAVYPVDARGLMTLPFTDASKRPKLNSKTHQIPQSELKVDQKNIDSMNYIADLTGGKAFYNTNDVEGAIRRAIDDSAVTYTLGYYLPDENWDNKYHKIKVKVNRSGVAVRTKKGYFALQQPTPTPVQLDQILREAVWSPLDATAITVVARIDPSTTLPNASKLTVMVNPAELQFQPDSSKYRDDIDLVLAQQTTNGKRLADVKKTLQITVTAAQLDQLRKNGLKTQQDVALNPDTQAVRIVVMDRRSGATGSVTVPVTAADKSGANLPAPHGG